MNKRDIFTFTAKKVDCRLMLSGAFYDKGYVIATDGRILIKAKASYPYEYEGTTRTEKGEVIEGKYPNYTKVLIDESDKERLRFRGFKELLEGAVDYYKNSMDKDGRKWCHLLLNDDYTINYDKARKLLKFLNSVKEGDKLTLTFEDKYRFQFHNHANGELCTFMLDGIPMGVKAKYLKYDKGGFYVDYHINLGGNDAK